MAAKKAASSSPSPKKPTSPKKEKSLPPADSDPGFLVEQPVSIWNRHLKADFPKLFSSLGTAIGAFTFGKWDSGIKSILDAATAIGIKASPAQVAWRLIFISLARATDALIEEAVSFDLFDTEDKDSAAKAALIAAKLEDITISLEPDFFEHPGKLSILKPFSTASGFKSSRLRMLTLLVSPAPMLIVFAANSARFVKFSRGGLIE